MLCYVLVDVCLCFVQINEKPLICASASGNIKLVELLLTYGANINQGDGVTSTFFFDAYAITELFQYREMGALH